MVSWQGRPEARIQPFHSLDREMPVTRRRAVSSEQVQALTDTIAALQADYARLDRANADLKAERDLRKQERDLLKHKIKFLQVTVSILLASSAGLGTGLAISMAGYTAEIALTIATTFPRRDHGLNDDPELPASMTTDLRPLRRVLCRRRRTGSPILLTVPARGR